EPADGFIHGAILGKGGTCASIPVVYAAVGRRLGYPMKIVSAKGPGFDHLLARWDNGQGERLNIEGTGHGLSCHPDESYRTGFYAITPDIEKKGRFLVSMTPREELAIFLAQRFHFWRDVGKDRRAIDAMAWASALIPENEGFRNSLIAALNAWEDKIEKRRPN